MPSLTGSKDSVSARMVARAIKTISFAVSCGSTSAFKTAGRCARMWATGVTGNICATISTVMMGIGDSDIVVGIVSPAVQGAGGSERTTASSH